VAGDYGEINSRADFFRVLSRARELTRAYLQKFSDDWALNRINTELDAIQNWTANGREPSEEERGRVDIGLVAVRELEDSPLDGMEEYCQLLCGLDAYVEDWPDDATANASPENPAIQRPDGLKQRSKEEFFDLYFRFSGAEAAGMSREEYHKNFFEAEEKPGMTYWAQDPPNSDDITMRIVPTERELHLFLDEVPVSTDSPPKPPHVSYGVEEPDL